MFLVFLDYPVEARFKLIFKQTVYDNKYFFYHFSGNTFRNPYW